MVELETRFELVLHSNSVDVPEYFESLAEVNEWIAWNPLDPTDKYDIICNTRSLVYTNRE